MKVAIVGTRDFPYPDWVWSFVVSLHMTDVVVSGGGGEVDRTAERAAKSRGMASVIFNAGWRAHDRAAGPLRNTEIVNYCDRVVAFWDGRSKGTSDTISKARAAGKPVMIVSPDGTLVNL